MSYDDGFGDVLHNEEFIHYDFAMPEQTEIETLQLEAKITSLTTEAAELRLTILEREDVIAQLRRDKIELREKENRLKDSVFKLILATTVLAVAVFGLVIRIKSC